MDKFNSPLWQLMDMLHEELFDAVTHNVFDFGQCRNLTCSTIRQRIEQEYS